MKHYIIRMRDTSYTVVGPFETQDDAAKWGRRDQAENGDDPRWQTIELADPHHVEVVAPEVPSEPIMPQYGTVWRHYKGTLYKIIGPGIIEATERLAVIYQDADNKLSPFWIRPLSEWHENVPPHGPRFRQVSAVEGEIF